MKKRVLLGLLLLSVLLVVSGCVQCKTDADCHPTEKCVNNVCKSTKQISIAVFVDENTYSKLSTEINRYKLDIINDLTTETQEVNVFIYHRNWNNEEEIKEKIIDLFRNSGLIGAILIGDIPAKYINYTHPLTFPPVTETVPIDYYYVDVEEIGDYSKTWILGKPQIKIWLGRLKPPVNGEMSIDLLKKYFDRNHDYRTGRLNFNKEMLLYAPSIVEESGLDMNYIYDFYIKNAIRNKQKTYKFSKESIIVPDNTDIKIDKKYLEKLEIPYEYVIYMGHGTPTSTEIDIDYNLIKQIEPQAMFYEFVACSVGKFTEENYLAGWYLFSGNALVIEAPTMPMVSGTTFLEHYLLDVGFYILEHGGTFGDRLLARGMTPTDIVLGDPTLSLRYGKIDSTAKIKVDKDHLNFGTVGVNTNSKLSISIQNIGNETLDFKYTDYKVYNTPPRASALSWKCEEKVKGLPPSIVAGLPASTSITCTFEFNPPIKGKYEYFFDICSNDKDNYWIRIPITGQVI